MLPFFIRLLPSYGIAVLTAAILMPWMIRRCVDLRLVDIPNERKLHSMPVPAVGGLTVMLTLAVTSLFCQPLRTLFGEHPALACCLAVMTFTGVLDDRLNLPPLLRLLIQLGCSFAVAFSGIRLQSLFGMFGVVEMPIIAQYILTILILTGVTNAFNLIDGIDGLAGGFALVNISVLAILAFVAGVPEWLWLFAPIAGALVVFLKYNWRPARVFMGDGGSLSLGFLMGAAGIAILSTTGKQNTAIQPSSVVVMITAYCMIPVMDTVRVFYARLRKGRSPFSADKNHLHHWLIRHHLVHSQATGRLLVFHGILIVGSAVAIEWLQATWVLIGQALLVFVYTWLLKLTTNFYRWYRFIKRMESVPVK